MVEIHDRAPMAMSPLRVSVLYREPMWLKWYNALGAYVAEAVSVLYREPMWLKSRMTFRNASVPKGFSALP